MTWHLNEAVASSAGKVAAGSIGDGPALVLAHGWPWSSYSWHRIIPALAKSYRVHWYDMPGYGQSDKSPDQPTSLDVQGRVFGEMLAHWGLDKPIVVAHDFGGATTLRAHLLHGHDYRYYVLMNVVAMRPWGSEFFDHVGKYVEAFRGVPAHIHRAIVEAYIRGALIRDLAPGDFDALVAPWLGEDGKASFYAQFAQADERYTAEVEKSYADICCPVAILWGEDDPWIPLARGQALHGLVGHSTMQVMPGLGHLPQLEAPDVVLEHLGRSLLTA